ncbi:MAG: AraC family transcriptional regulator ligand-binding domain-containing protein [Rhodospirillales bacterium]|nr:AraC family transcriptional regulator ligand-binding domain-containing protein [Rhodospirillales bacterium]
MRAIAMVRANALVPFVDFVEGIGGPIERLMQGARLPQQLFTDPERLVPMHQSLAFLGRIARSEGLLDLGLVVGQCTRFDRLGAFAQLGRGALTLHESLNRLIGAIALHSSGDRISLRYHGEHALLCHTFALPEVPGRRQGELFALSMMIEAIRAVVGPDWMPDEVRLAQSEKPNGSRIEAILKVPVVCAGRMQAVVFARSLLARRPANASPGPAADPEDYEVMRATAPANDFAGSVRQVIGALLNDGVPDIQQTAGAVGFSVRTLQRYLAVCGESYSHLVDAVRFDVATRLLRDRDAKLIEIACELGYADAANFTRAFRRWTGIAPSTFRRVQL